MFWEQFWPQLLATIVGAVLGIPGGIYFERWITKRTERERRESVISSLIAELGDNLDVLQEWKEKEGDYERGVLAEELSIETWKAFSEGGELKLFENPVFLHSLSRVYMQIRSLQSLSDKFFQVLVT